MASLPQQTFDAAYEASLPPQVAALAQIADLLARETEAAMLATQGFTIDVPIQVWGWDPYLVMTYRKQYGYTWVPSALQANISIAPGVSQPGTTPYDPNHPPSGSIKVSTNPADFPPFDPPTVTVPAPVTDPVGLQSVANLYLTVVGDTTPDGGQFIDSRGTFVKHITVTPFGRSQYWEKIS